MKREKEGWRTEGKVGQKKEVRERNIDRLKEGRTNGCKEEIIEEKYSFLQRISAEMQS